MSYFDELQRLVRQYCECLWSIKCGDIEVEYDRQEIHQKIADYLKCNKEMISPVLHNIDYTEKEGYLWGEACIQLRDLEKKGYLKG
jgi:hypothetical protein